MLQRSAALLGPTSPSPSTAGSISRRMLLTAAGLVTQQTPTRLAHAADEVLLVGPQQQYATVAAAVAAAAPGATVLLDAGSHVLPESLVLRQDITLAASPQAAAGSVELVCDTQQPYQHCIDVQGGRVEVTGVRCSHSSKSVANNFAVFAQGGGRLTLRGCDISSRSGAGVGVEGAVVVLERCRVHDCARQAVGVFGGLDGSPGRCIVQDCSITRNKLDGCLAKDGGELVLTDSTLEDNGGFGAQLRGDCQAQLTGNTFRGNRSGSVALELSSVEAVDAQQMARDNTLQPEGGVVLL